MRSSDTFTDYNFEGSVLSQLLDVLSYNTYYSALNANLVANEVFFDSASIRENVVSLAKLVGYTPRSAKAAKSNHYDGFCRNTCTSITYLKKELPLLVKMVMELSFSVF